MWIGIGFVILSNIAAIYVPVLVREGFNEALFQVRLSGSSGENFSGAVAQTAAIFGFFIVLAALIKGLFMYLMRQYLIVVSRKVEFDLKNDLYTKYQSLGADFYRGHFTGDLMARIGEDVSNVRMYVGPAIMYTVNLLFTFLTVLYQMFSINAELTLYVLLPLPLLSFSIYRVSRVIHLRNTAIQSQLSVLTTYAQESFAGIRVIKSFGAEKSFVDGFLKETEEYKKRNLGLAKVNALFFPLMTLLVGFSSLTVLYLGGRMAFEGRFTPGNIAEFVIYLNMLIWPVASLGWVTALVQKAASSQKRINEYLLWEEPKGESGREQLFSLAKELEIKNLHFSYKEDLPAVFSGLNLKIKQGEILGITGRTGSGKSTLAQILAGVYDAPEGTVFYDGIPQEKLKRQAHRKGIAYVPQDVFLFSESVAENIAFGSEVEVSREEIEKAAWAAGLQNDMAFLPNGLDTMLGERGVTLSGGQKQRVSVARALVKNAELYILDDCISAVDAETEKHIIQQLFEKLKGKTAIIISHRIAPLTGANRIVYLANQGIAEIGTHRELLEKGGEYAKLFEKQLVSEEHNSITF